MTKYGNHHESLVRDEQVTGASERGFGIVLAAVFAIIGALPLLGDAQPWWWAFLVTIAFCVFAFVWPRALKPLNRIWIGFALILHRKVSPLIMGLIFFLSVVPVGLVMRMLGKDALSRKFDPATESYWIERHPPGPAPQSMKDQF